MCDTIRKLYKGEIDPLEEQLKPDSGYYEFINQMSALEDKAMEIMTEEQHQIFEEYVTVRNEYGFMMNQESFIQGYKLGAQMTLETFK